MNDLLDYRTPEQLRSYDSIQEKRWRWRVSRRAAQPRRQIPLVSRLGDLDPHRQGATEFWFDGRDTPARSRAAASNDDAYICLYVRSMSERWPVFQRLSEGKEV